MPICKTCGALYTKSLGVCPNCNAQDKMAQYEQEAQQQEPLPAEDMRKLVRRRWITICIGVPGLIAFLYIIIYSMNQWHS